jgi:signal transduction histidine kinase
MKTEQPEAEVARLRHCIRDLVSLVALPAEWSERGGDPSEFVRTLLDVLPDMLKLDLLYVHIGGLIGGRGTELAWMTPAMASTDAEAIGAALRRSLGGDPRHWPSSGELMMGSIVVTLLPLRIGLQGELGVIVGGARRANFPDETERLLLMVARNQALIVLHDAQRLIDQRRVATRAEEELHRNAAFLTKVQQVSVTGGFYWWPGTGKVLWSEQVYRIFEIDPAAPLTTELRQSRIHPDDLPAHRETVQRAIREGRDFEYEVRLLMPDKSVKYVHSLAQATCDAEQNLLYVGAVQDVTQRRLSDFALNKVRSELAHIARVTTLSALTASIAHEVNQPLSGVVTNASTCLRMLGVDPPNIEGARETARRTIRDGNRAAEVITRLRALYSGMEAKLEPVDLNETAREVLALFLNELHRHGVVVRTEFAENLAPVMGDRVQLQQVVLNLVRNASEAMSSVDDRSRELLVKTEPDERDAVRLSVRDAGVGFEPEAADKLFGAFYTTKADGMGMGLSVSRSIIERHRGRLWAARNQGPGATFAFAVPASNSSRADTKV